MSQTMWHAELLLYIWYRQTFLICASLMHHHDDMTRTRTHALQFLYTTRYVLNLSAVAGGNLPTKRYFSVNSNCVMPSQLLLSFPWYQGSLSSQQTFSIAPILLPCCRCLALIDTLPHASTKSHPVQLTSGHLPVMMSTPLPSASRGNTLPTVTFMRKKPQSRWGRRCMRASCLNSCHFHMS